MDSGARYACVIDRGHRVADLGSTALTVVALVEYWRATDDRRYQDLAIELAEWVLYMQRDNGSFAHRYDVKAKTIDQEAHLLYYSGEAALALARMHTMTGDQRYIDAAEKALDDQIGLYDFFIGGFFYGEDHWTCIAAEAAYPAVKKRQYFDFCADYAEFLRTHQLAEGDFPSQGDLAGSYMFTPFAMPANTPVGSRSEAMISTYLLGRQHGVDDRELYRQIMAAMRFALGQQIRPEQETHRP